MREFEDRRYGECIERNGKGDNRRKKKRVPRKGGSTANELFIYPTFVKCLPLSRREHPRDRTQGSPHVALANHSPGGQENALPRAVASRLFLCSFALPPFRLFHVPAGFLNY